MSPPSAPPGLKLVLDFVNTLDVESGDDELHDADHVAEWFRQRGLLHAGTSVAAKDVDVVVRVREELRTALLRTADDTDHADEQECATPAIASIPLTVTLDQDGRPTLTPTQAGVAGALGQLLATIPTAVADGSWDRAKVCLAETCRWAFYDTSRNRSRRWCSMAVCGNREKTRTFRKKHDSPAD